MPTPMQDLVSNAELYILTQALTPYAPIFKAYLQSNRDNPSCRLSSKFTQQQFVDVIANFDKGSQPGIKQSGNRVEFGSIIYDPKFHELPVSADEISNPLNSVLKNAAVSPFGTTSGKHAHFLPSHHTFDHKNRHAVANALIPKEISFQSNIKILYTCLLGVKKKFFDIFKKEIVDRGMLVIPKVSGAEAEPYSNNGDDFNTKNSAVIIVNDELPLLSIAAGDGDDQHEHKPFAESMPNLGGLLEGHTIESLTSIWEENFLIADLIIFFEYMPAWTKGCAISLTSAQYHKVKNILEKGEKVIERTVFHELLLSAINFDQLDYLRKLSSITPLVDVVFGKEEGGEQQPSTADYDEGVPEQRVTEQSLEKCLEMVNMWDDLDGTTEADKLIGAISEETEDVICELLKEILYGMTSRLNLSPSEIMITRQSFMAAIAQAQVEARSELSPIQLTLYLFPDAAMEKTTLMRLLDMLNKRPVTQSSTHIFAERKALEAKDIHDLQVFIPLIILFIIVSFTGRGISDYVGYGVTTGMNNLIAGATYNPCTLSFDSATELKELVCDEDNDVGLDSISVPSDVYGFLNSFIPSVLWPSTNATAGSTKVSTSLSLVGALRIRQQRVAAEEVAVIGKADLFPTHQALRFPPLGYGTRAESPHDVLKNNAIIQSVVVAGFDGSEYKNCDELSLEKANCLEGTSRTYGCDGYAIDVPFNTTREEYLSVVNEIALNSWIDRATRAVMVDYFLFHPSSGMVLMSKHLLELYPGGGTSHRFEAQPFYLPVRVDYSHGTMAAYILFILCLALYTARTLFQIYKNFSSMFRKLWGASEDSDEAAPVSPLSDEPGSATIEESQAKAVAGMKKSAKMQDDLMNKLSFGYSNLTMFFVFVIQLSNPIIFIVSLAMYKGSGVLFTNTPTFDPVWQLDHFPIGYEAAYTRFDNSIVLDCVNIVVSIMLLLQYTRNMELFSAIIGTFQRAVRPGVALALTSVGVIFGFAVCATMAFGTTYEGYHAVQFSLLTLIGAFWGSWDMDSLQGKDQYVGAYLFVMAFNVVIVIALISATTAVFSDAFTAEQDSMFDPTDLKAIIHGDTLSTLRKSRSTNFVGSIFRYCFGFIQSIVYYTRKALHSVGIIDKPPGVYNYYFYNSLLQMDLKELQAATEDPQPVLRRAIRSASRLIILMRASLVTTTNIPTPADMDNKYFEERACVYKYVFKEVFQKEVMDYTLTMVFFVLIPQFKFGSSGANALLEAANQRHQWRNDTVKGIIEADEGEVAEIKQLHERLQREHKEKRKHEAVLHLETIQPGENRRKRIMRRQREIDEKLQREKNEKDSNVPSADLPAMVVEGLSTVSTRLFLGILSLAPEKYGLHDDEEQDRARRVGRRRLSRSGSRLASRRTSMNKPNISSGIINMSSRHMSTVAGDEESCASYTTTAAQSPSRVRGAPVVLTKELFFEIVNKLQQQGHIPHYFDERSYIEEVFDDKLTEEQQSRLFVKDFRPLVQAEFALQCLGFQFSMDECVRFSQEARRYIKYYADCRAGRKSRPPMRTQASWYWWTKLKRLFENPIELINQDMKATELMEEPQISFAKPPDDTDRFLPLSDFFQCWTAATGKAPTDSVIKRLSLLFGEGKPVDWYLFLYACQGDPFSDQHVSFAGSLSRQNNLEWEWALMLTAYLPMLVIYFVILLFQSDGESIHMANSLRNSFAPSDPVFDLGQVSDWLVSSVDNIWSDQAETLDPSTLNLTNTIVHNGVNYFIGAVRVMQWRVELDSKRKCDRHFKTYFGNPNTKTIKFNGYKGFSAENDELFDFYSERVTADFPDIVNGSCVSGWNGGAKEAEDFTSENSLHTDTLSPLAQLAFVHRAFQAPQFLGFSTITANDGRYASDGFYFDIPVNATADEAAAYVQEVLSNHWIDTHTRMVALRMSLYNHNLGLVTTVRFGYEVTIGGNIGPVSHVDAVQLTPVPRPAVLPLYICLLALVAILFMRDSVELFLSRTRYDMSIISAFEEFWTYGAIVRYYLFVTLSLTCVWHISWYSAGILPEHMTLENNGDYSELLERRTQDSTVLRAFEGANFMILTIVVMYYISVVTRMDIIFEAFGLAFKNLLAIGALYLLVVVAFTCTLVLLWGFYLPTAADFGSAFLFMFINASDGTLPDGTDSTRSVLSPFVQIVFLITVTYTLFNMVTASLSGAFEKAKEDLYQPELVQACILTYGTGHIRFYRPQWQRVVNTVIKRTIFGYFYQSTVNFWRSVKLEVFGIGVQRENAILRGRMPSTRLGPSSPTASSGPSTPRLRSPNPAHSEANINADFYHDISRHPEQQKFPNRVSDYFHYSENVFWAFMEEWWNMVDGKSPMLAVEASANIYTVMQMTRAVSEGDASIYAMSPKMADAKEMFGHVKPEPVALTEDRFYEFGTFRRMPLWEEFAFTVFGNTLPELKLLFIRAPSLFFGARSLRLWLVAMEEKHYYDLQREAYEYNAEDEEEEASGPEEGGDDDEGGGRGDDKSDIYGNDDFNGGPPELNPLLATTGTLGQPQNSVLLDPVRMDTEIFSPKNEQAEPSEDDPHMPIAPLPEEHQPASVANLSPNSSGDMPATARTLPYKSAPPNLSSFRSPAVFAVPPPIPPQPDERNHPQRLEGSSPVQDSQSHIEDEQSPDPPSIFQAGLGGGRTPATAAAIRSAISSNEAPQSTQTRSEQQQQQQQQSLFPPITGVGQKANRQSPGDWLTME